MGFITRISAVFRTKIDHASDYFVSPKPSDDVEFECVCGQHSPSEKLQVGSQNEIVFVFEEGSRWNGSVDVRATQMADLLKTYTNLKVSMLGRRKVMRDPSRLTECILVFSKYAAIEVPINCVSELKANRAFILFDLVDAPVGKVAHKGPDGFIAASRSEDQHWKRLGKRSWLVHHLVDARFRDSKRANRSHFDLVYAGMPGNSLFVEELMDSMRVIKTKVRFNDKEFSSWARDLSKATHHYMVRDPSPSKGFKALNKAFVASLLGGVVIASRADSEARSLLGDDYPYLTTNELEDVRETIKFAQESYLSRDWELAQERIMSLRSEFCPHSVISQFTRMVREIEV